MNRELNEFTATQTETGFRVMFHDNPEELELSISDLNEFANRYAKEMMTGKKPELTEKEEIMISIWEMVLLPSDVKH
ncbi:MAG: hypothetical protein ACREOP_04050 [Thermodesulfobacteriota bacterium]|jgi:hypothetical protein|nr:MAG: hypothetical protein A3J42_08200 [Candidatus Dadabacteria bacterium RIFCSPHIGHO2_12_FULL_53_21]